MDNFNKAVFLDRDGVINKERKDYVKTVDELELLPDVAESIKTLKEAGFLVVVITNQSAINRGLTNHVNVKQIHSAIQDWLLNKNTSLDGFYYCPHRPDENCDCRKPKPGLLIKASNDLNIDLKSSWMIGNNDSDMMAAKLAGCKMLKIGTASDLLVAVKKIINNCQ